MRFVDAVAHHVRCGENYVVDARLREAGQILAVSRPLVAAFDNLGFRRAEILAGGTDAVRNHLEDGVFTFDAGQHDGGLKIGVGAGRRVCGCGILRFRGGAGRFARGCEKQNQAEEQGENHFAFHVRILLERLVARRAFGTERLLRAGRARRADPASVRPRGRFCRFRDRILRQARAC
ncbi:hypothetical protein SDC9_132075 [bioreactor metagenome]|uniref:Uncharacterized protein n=1 Tax=bioreactor metagenome TaxID=1076179 RepID=A0A645D7G1_9ZZZZ